MERRRASFASSIVASIAALATGAMLIVLWTRLTSRQNDAWYAAYWTFTALAIVFAIGASPGPRRRWALALVVVVPVAQLAVAAYVLAFNRSIV